MIIKDFFVVILVFCMFIILVIWFYIKEDIIFKYNIDLKDYNDEAEDWLKEKKIWYINDGDRHFRFIRKSNAAMFKIIWS